MDYAASRTNKEDGHIGQEVVEYLLKTCGVALDD